jgi:hypothetical protein
MSQELLSFLRAYAKWAYEDGAPESPIFDNTCGLCTNLDNYAKEIFPGRRSETKHELLLMFSAEDLSTVYPFGSAAYDQDTIRAMQHSNPLRRAWVLRKLSEHDNDGI